jgi:DNA repair protein RecO (recombination protein O)
MLVKTKAIVVSTLRYQEKNLIVKCFTASDGMKSYFVRGAFGSKKAGQKIAYFQPLTVLEIEATHKNKGTLEYLNEIKLAFPLETIHLNVVKSSISLFISEMLYVIIQEEERNEDLFHFLETAILWLDTHPHVANFHLIFLMEMTKFLGFYPDQQADVFPYFDMLEGIFTPDIRSTCLIESETRLIKKLMGLKFDHTQNTFNVTERQILLKILLDYYQLHLGNFRKPKSWEILKEVFS